jgi:hypothetical protein
MAMMVMMAMMISGLCDHVVSISVHVCKRCVLITPSLLHVPSFCCHHLSSLQLFSSLDVCNHQQTHYQLVQTTQTNNKHI